jgi:tetratricopeptide (TPR) repeat protein
MKVIRWFLSHIVLIILVVVVIYGYMFWGNLIGENTPAGKAIAYLSDEFVVVEEFVEAVKEKQAQLSSESPSSEDQSSGGAAENGTSEQADESVASSAPSHKATTVAGNEKPTQQAQSAPAQPTSTQQAVATAPVLTQSRQAPQPMPNRPMSNRQGREAASRLQSSSNADSSSSRANINDGVAGALVPSAPKHSDVFISEKVEKQLDNVDGGGKVIDPSQQAADVRTSWITARKSFYQRKYDVSEKSYQDVIDNAPDNFDAYGELGNVYFNQGKNKQAAAAYFSAASIMIEKGQVNRARGLLGLLRHLDKDKADELQKLITSATSSPS